MKGLFKKKKLSQETKDLTGSAAGSTKPQVDLPPKEVYDVDMSDVAPPPYDKALSSYSSGECKVELDGSGSFVVSPKAGIKRKQGESASHQIRRLCLESKRLALLVKSLHETIKEAKADIKSMDSLRSIFHKQIDLKGYLKDRKVGPEDNTVEGWLQGNPWLHEDALAKEIFKTEKLEVLAKSSKALQQKADDLEDVMNLQKISNKEKKEALDEIATMMKEIQQVLNSEEEHSSFSEGSRTYANLATDAFVELQDHDKGDESFINAVDLLGESLKIDSEV